MKAQTLKFLKINTVWFVIGIILIISGYVIMGWNTSQSATYEQRVFAWHKLTLAPIVLIMGYFSIFLSIMYIRKD
jgi:hypothetical protein